MNAALARLQNERGVLLRRMLCLHRWGGFSFAGHPWAEQARSLHDEAECVRQHHNR